MGSCICMRVRAPEDLQANNICVQRCECVCVFQEFRADGRGLDDAPEERQADEELPGAKARPKSKEWC